MSYQAGRMKQRRWLGTDVGLKIPCRAQQIGPNHNANILDAHLVRLLVGHDIVKEAAQEAEGHVVASRQRTNERLGRGCTGR